MPDPDSISGFEVARGHKYEMHEIGFADTLQPRLGGVWAYDPAGTVSTSPANVEKGS